MRKLLMASAICFCVGISLLLIACTVSPAIPVSAPATLFAATQPTQDATIRPSTVLVISQTPSAPLAGSPTAASTQTPSDTATPELKPTATFNAVQAVKRTPAPQAQCPVEDQALVPNFTRPEPGYAPPDFDRPVLDFLNQGGTQSTLVHYMLQIKALRLGEITQMDLTNDGVPELIISNGNLSVYMCANGKYYVALRLTWDSEAVPELLAIRDLNLDGVPELLIFSQDTVPSFWIGAYQLFEWNGQSFQQLINLDLDCPGPGSYGPPCNQNGWLYSEGFEGYDSEPTSLTDIDHNGTVELVIRDGIGTTNALQYYGPWRAKTTVLMWNGETFAFYKYSLDPPTYRFQAVQDADQATIEGRYADAQDLYQAVIFDNKLEWWSADRQAYNSDSLYYRDMGTEVPPTPPSPDPKEYANLAAYARYRLMLLHVLQRDLASAKVIYETLQQKSPVATPGHIYVEMASAFWREYQASQDVGLACGKVVILVSDHEDEALTYISGKNFDHGYQSVAYKVEYLCPFK